MLKAGLDHVLQFVFILWRHHDHVRDMAEIGEVERPVVRRPVFCNQPSPVDTEHDRKILRRHIVHHLIVGPLKKRRIHSHHRLHSLRC